MPIFQYLTFVCEQVDLQSALSEHGLKGWRLHTCEPIVTVGPQGSGILQTLIVMDRVVVESGEDEDPLDAPEGIPMKG